MTTNTHFEMDDRQVESTINYEIATLIERDQTDYEVDDLVNIVMETLEGGRQKTTYGLTPSNEQVIVESLMPIPVHDWNEVWERYRGECPNFPFCDVIYVDQEGKTKRKTLRVSLWYQEEDWGKKKDLIRVCL